MQDYEKLGAFYLGREYDPAAKQLQDNMILYDSRDLVTHAVFQIVPPCPSVFHSRGGRAGLGGEPEGRPASRTTWAGRWMHLPRGDAR